MVSAEKLILFNTLKDLTCPKYKNPLQNNIRIRKYLFTLILQHFYNQEIYLRHRMQSVKANITHFLSHDVKYLMTPHKVLM